MANQISKNNLFIVKLDFRISWNRWIRTFENVEIQKSNDIEKNERGTLWHRFTVKVCV